MKILAKIGFAALAVMAIGVSAQGLKPGQTLMPGQYINSDNNLYNLIMQDDGNLVMYDIKSGKSIWSTSTNHHPGAWLAMQTDGNLVIYEKGSANALWHTHTYDHPGASLVLQNDRNLVIYGTDNKPLWNTGTFLTPSTGGGGTTNPPSVPCPGNNNGGQPIVSVFCLTSPPSPFSGVQHLTVYQQACSYSQAKDIAQRQAINWTISDGVCPSGF
jgi:hypothetical protein